jgi:hypothetical protein
MRAIMLARPIRIVIGRIRRGQMMLMSSTSTVTNGRDSVAIAGLFRLMSRKMRRTTSTTFPAIEEWTQQ